MGKVTVNETRREINYRDGIRDVMTNVTSFDNTGNWLRMESDEGYTIANPTNINFIRIPNKNEKVA